MKKKSLLGLVTFGLFAGIALAGFTSNANADWWKNVKGKITSGANRLAAKGKIEAEHAAGRELAGAATKLQNAKE